jgi:hypothetical protein
MNLIMSLYVALLFVLLTPGVLIRLPPKGSLLTVAIVHGLVFALVFHFTHKVMYRMSVDGFTGAPATPELKKCPDGSMKAMC